MVIYISYYMGIVFRMSGEEIIQLKDTYITEFSRKIASDSGALLMQLFIIVSVLGTSNGLLLATIRVPYQFANLEKSRNFLNLNVIEPKTKMPVNSALLGLAIIVFYLFMYYITNTHPLFHFEKISTFLPFPLFLFTLLMVRFLSVCFSFSEKMSFPAIGFSNLQWR